MSDDNGACGVKRNETIMVRKTGETGTDNLSRIQSVSSKHFEAMGEDDDEDGHMNGNGGVDPGDVDIEEGKEGKDIDGDEDEEDEIEEDPDKRNRLDGYYVAMGIILGLCILGTLAYMAVTKVTHKEPELLMTTEGPSSTNPPKTPPPANWTMNDTMILTNMTTSVPGEETTEGGGGN